MNTSYDGYTSSLASQQPSGIIWAILGVSLFFAILTVIGRWKVYKKAGRHGIASLIPVWNEITFFQVGSENGWTGAIYVLLSVFATALWYVVNQISASPTLTSMLSSNNKAVAAILGAICATCLLLLWFEISNTHKLSKHFGKGIGTTLGLLLLPEIFYPVLGFGKAEYDQGINQGEISEDSEENAEGDYPENAENDGYEGSEDYYDDEYEDDEYEDDPQSQINSPRRKSPARSQQSQPEYEPRKARGNSGRYSQGNVQNMNRGNNTESNSRYNSRNLKKENSRQSQKTSQSNIQRGSREYASRYSGNIRSNTETLQKATNANNSRQKPKQSQNRGRYSGVSQIKAMNSGGVSSSRGNGKGRYASTQPKKTQEKHGRYS